MGASNNRPPAHVAKQIVGKLLDAGILAQAARLQPQAYYSTLRLVGAWEEHRRFFDANEADNEGEDEAA